MVGNMILVVSNLPVLLPRSLRFPRYLNNLVAAVEGSKNTGLLLPLLETAAAAGTKKTSSLYKFILKNLKK